MCLICRCTFPLPCCPINQVTEIAPEFTAEGTSAAAGAYGKTVSYVLIGLKTAKVLLRENAQQ
jgi:hypothetical protein